MLISSRFQRDYSLEISKAGKYSIWMVGEEVKFVRLGNAQPGRRISIAILLWLGSVNYSGSAILYPIPGTVRIRLGLLGSYSSFSRRRRILTLTVASLSTSLP